MAIDSSSREDHPGPSIKRKPSLSKGTSGGTGTAKEVSDLKKATFHQTRQIKDWEADDRDVPPAQNPVVCSADWAYQATDLVKIDEEGVRAAADYINKSLETNSYTPRTWRIHSLHICPPEPYSPAEPQTKKCLDWIFLIASLNFSFWSEKDDNDRYGVEWREGWESSKYRIWTGYWSLVAAINRALEEDIPIIDSAFYSSSELCSDALIEYVFRPCHRSKEDLPMLKDRISIMRENGNILCEKFGGSFQNFIQEFQRKHQNRGTALQLVQMATETFPTFRDETHYKGHKLYFWKRAQIMIAETWAAFYPPSPAGPHPLFPAGAAIHQLTMFADYRVPQIMHHLRILAYPPALTATLQAGALLETGCREEVSIRAASILGVERMREEIAKMRRGDEEGGKDAVSSVVIDFYLWDLAKSVEGGGESVGVIQTVEMVPAHRMRSIWY
ncbi:hypothetical protein NEOLEDRAFT_1161678 [Neolentinus lepideus HHB14362 ss-1]|uniref:Queuosine 5'-phosphate N-glycosylase/hydrolase n=1 Tax=Neolentinus lepideus HHB14362 ss-1 TaxID=1314782 RepID=A0A165TZU4_9AGAM|nr:hypothetical protein NEOLEDRAFT_1161678 [Neolentinus lepideus HHB14362 ss-1]